MTFDARQPVSTRSAVIRALILVLVLASAFAAARWTPLADWLERDLLAQRLIAFRKNPWTGPALVGMFGLFGLIGLPVSPLMLSGAALFGPIGGWIYNLAGCILGALTSFGTGRWLGGDLIRKVVGAARLEAMTRLWDRHGFWTVFRLRFLPIPFPFVNYGAALAGIPFGTYFLASVFGLGISVGVWTYLFHTLFEAAAGEHRGVIVKGIIALAGILAISFLPPLLTRKTSSVRSKTE